MLYNLPHLIIEIYIENNYVRVCVYNFIAFILLQFYLVAIIISLYHSYRCVGSKLGKVQLTIVKKDGA